MKVRKCEFSAALVLANNIFQEHDQIKTYIYISHKILTNNCDKYLLALEKGHYLQISSLFYLFYFTGHQAIKLK